MAVRAKLMMSAGIAFAGLGLVGAGAGATFTAEVGGSTSLSTGNLGLSLNGSTGSGLELGVDGTNIGSDFAPIVQDLRLKNTGTLDMAASYLDLTVAGCDGGKTAPLAQALHVEVTDVTHARQVYDGPLCSFAHDDTDGHTNRTASGRHLDHSPDAGESIHYRLVLAPNDPVEGLPPAALDLHMSVQVDFTGYDH